MGLGEHYCQPNPKDPTLLLLVNQLPVSQEKTLEIYRWDSSGVSQIFTVPNWGEHLADLNHDGGRQIICMNRYGPDNILAYRNGEIVIANFDYPENYHQVIQEMGFAIDDPGVPDHEKLFKEEYGDWLPAYLYAGQLRYGLYVVQQLREIAKRSTNPEDQKARGRLEEKFERFESEVKILQGSETKKIMELKTKIPLLDKALSRDEGN